MICKLCKKEKKLINSHIIPKVFFEFLYPESGDRKSLIMIGKNKHNKRRPIGSYEKLLCKECDHMLGVYDDYAQKLLLGDSLKFYPNTSSLAYIIKTYDYFQLKMFFISLLWRSSISNLEEFGLIDCGPYEEKLRQMILENSVGQDDEFSIFIAKFDSKDKKIKKIAESSILLPAKQKIDGLNYSIFYLSNGYKIYLKVDKRKTADVYVKLILKEGRQVAILRMDDYEKTPEYKILLDTVR
ncbi:MAG: hypothetical protein ACD_9C00339G0002 [uncultured bacterium]|nr:MAG: hypothetical protein ACD_9C00339G0002 [uncultured bacterium]